MPSPITNLQAIALPLLRDNVDTDELIPVSENTRVSMNDWGDGLFAAKRYLDGAGRTPDPDFILNQPPFDRAQILVSGANFGCGSSRESAVWALRDYGFRIVVAISFNETFKRNCIVNGVAPLTVTRADAERLAAAILQRPDLGMSVDLARGTLVHDVGVAIFPFELDPFYRALLTSGSTEDDMLGALQGEIDLRRDAILAAQPWLRSGGRHQIG
jgi:3-isopropylmalate/(R)-2-methylmalate dehydratase small subunit